MKRSEFVKAVQRYVANVAISGSTLRNQGAPDVVKNARSFLAELDLAPLRMLAVGDYPEWLNSATTSLLLAFPAGARDRWGASRKALNIFMTQACLNRELASEFGLERFAEVMETALDSMAAEELRSKPAGEKLPRWPGVGELKAGASQKYQDFALKVARTEGIPRGFLDLVLWRSATSAER